MMAVQIKIDGWEGGTHSCTIFTCLALILHIHDTGRGDPEAEECRANSKKWAMM